MHHAARCAKIRHLYFTFTFTVLSLFLFFDPQLLFFSFLRKQKSKWRKPKTETEEKEKKMGHQKRKRKDKKSRRKDQEKKSAAPPSIEAPRFLMNSPYFKVRARILAHLRLRLSLPHRFSLEKHSRRRSTLSSKQVDFTCLQLPGSLERRDL